MKDWAFEGAMLDPAMIELVRKRLAEKCPTAEIRARAAGEGFDVEFFLHWKARQDQRVRVARERFEAANSAEQILTPLALDHVWLGHSILVDASGKIVLDAYP